MEMVDNFDSRPHKAVTFLVERNQKFQVWREQKMPRAQSGSSGGKLPRRSKVEKREEEEAEEEDQEKKMENEVIRRIIAGVPKEADTVGGGVTRNTVSEAQSTNAGEKHFRKSEPGFRRQACCERDRAGHKGRSGTALKSKTILEKEMSGTGMKMTR